MAVIAKVTWEPGTLCLITVHGLPHTSVALTVRRSTLPGLMSNYPWTPHSTSEQLFDPWDTKAIVEASCRSYPVPIATPQLRAATRSTPGTWTGSGRHSTEIDWLEVSAFLLNFPSHCNRPLGLLALFLVCGSSSIGRVPAFQADCCGFESRLPLHFRGLKMPIIALKVVQASAHPNAERLRIYQFSTPEGPLQVVANTDNLYAEGDLVAVALIGTILEDGTEIQKGKFRGERSFGMALGKTTADEGADLTADFNATSVVKRIDESTGVVEESAWVRYTSLEGYLKLKEDILAAPEVIVLEKSHGSNFRAGYRGETYLVGTHTSRVLPSRMASTSWPDQHLLAKALRWAESIDLETQVMAWKAKHPEVTQMGFFGELMGYKCSDLHYGETTQYVKLFGEVQVNGRFLSYDDAVLVLKELLPAQDVDSMLIPVLYRGKPTHEILRKLRDLPSTMAKANGADQISEGIVIRANPEAFSNISKDRLIAKWKGPLYSERKSLRDLDPETLPTYLSAHDLIFDFITEERIRHVWQRAQASGVALSMKNLNQIATLLFEDILKESKGEWPQEAPLDHRVLIRWTRTIAADMIAMVMQDKEIGLHG